MTRRLPGRVVLQLETHRAEAGAILRGEWQPMSVLTEPDGDVGRGAASDALAQDGRHAQRILLTSAGLNPLDAAHRHVEAEIAAVVVDRNLQPRAR
jgi:hypothetical protein